MLSAVLLLLFVGVRSLLAGNYCEVGNDAALHAATSNRSCHVIGVVGEILITESVWITRSVVLKGVTQDAGIIQTNSIRDCLIIRDVRSGVAVTNLLVDCRDAQVAVVVANTSNVYVSHLTIFGPPHIFTIFYAGADVAAHQPTLDNFASKTDMDTNNTFSNNVVNASWGGDTVSFSLQYRGYLENNTVVNGGKIAFYMNAYSLCAGNTVVDSVSQGIFLSSPSVGNLLINNIILNAKYGGITMKHQLEHTPEDPNHDMRSWYDVIQSNTFESNSYIAIEVNDANCLGIWNNEVARYHSMAGIYFQHTVNTTMWRNEIGVFDNWTGSVFKDVHSYDADNMIMLDALLPYDEAVSGVVGSCAMPPYDPAVDVFPPSLTYSDTPTSSPTITPPMGPHYTYAATDASCLGTEYSPCGPTYWGKYAPACDGDRQSPIAITKSRVGEGLQRPRFKGSLKPCNSWSQTVTSGSVFEVHLDGYCERMYLRYEKENYSLQKIQFHSPSEHSLSGGYYSAEAQLVHFSEKRGYFIVGVMLEAQSDLGNFFSPPNNTLLNTVSSIHEGAPPMEVEVEVKKHEEGINPYVSLLPASSLHYLYEGSLTSPPCTEGVQWMVFDQPVKISQLDLGSLRQFTVNSMGTTVAGNNNRFPTAPLHKRDVLMYTGANQK